MKSLSRCLKEIAALDYKNYEEWKKDFDDESKIDYQAVFSPFLSAKKFTVKSIKEFFVRRACCFKRLARLQAWAKSDWIKVQRQTPDVVRHPRFLVEERKKCFYCAIQEVEDLIFARADEIVKIASSCTPIKENQATSKIYTATQAASYLL